MSLTALLARVVGYWLAILLCAIGNGALREGILVPRFGNPTALALSGLLLIACVAAAAFLLVRHTPRLRAAQALAIGMLWLVLTVAFEFGFGLLQGKSLDAMLAPIASSVATSGLWCSWFSP